MKKLIILAAFLQFGCAHYTPTDYLKFGAGALSSMVIHEAGHKVMSEIEHNPMEFDGLIGHYKYPISRQIKMAGLTANAVTNELIMQIRPKRKDRDPFWTGLLWAGTFEEFTYPVFRFGGHDFKNAGHSWGFRIGFTLHSLTVIWREIWQIMGE